MGTFIWGGRGEEVCEGDGERTKRGIRRLPMFSPSLSLRKHAERETELWGAEPRRNSNQQPLLQPAASAPRSTPPRCSGATLWPCPTAIALSCISAPLLLRTAADAPRRRVSGLRCLGRPAVRHGKLTLVQKQVHSPLLPYRLPGYPVPVPGYRTRYRYQVFLHTGYPVQSCIQSSSSAYKVLHTKYADGTRIVRANTKNPGWLGT